MSVEEANVQVDHISSLTRHLFDLKLSFESYQQNSDHEINCNH